MNSLDYAYLAGAIDGDGYIFLANYYVKDKKYSYPRVELISLDKEYLEKIGEKYAKSYSIRKGKRSWRLAFGLKDSKEILLKIKDYSVLKWKDISDVLRNKRPKRERNPSTKIWSKMKDVERQAYLAGMLDTDGCITIIRQGERGFRTDIRIFQKNKEFLEMLHNEYGGSYNEMQWRIPIKEIKRMDVFKRMLMNDNKRKRLEISNKIRLLGKEGFEKKGRIISRF